MKLNIFTNRNNLSVLCLCVVSTCLALACSSNLPSAFGGKNISWSHSENGKQAITGIDEASINFGVWGDGAAIAIWSPKSYSFGGSGMGGRALEPGESRKGVKYEGLLTSENNEKIPVSCYTADGKKGTVKIGEQEYQLENGPLFLVSVTNSTIKVKQLNFDKLNLKPVGSLTVDDISQEQLEEIAKTDQDIRSFFIDTIASE